jgi:hypothetical protein
MLAPRSSSRLGLSACDPKRTQFVSAAYINVHMDGLYSDRHAHTVGEFVSGAYINAHIDAYEHGQTCLIHTRREPWTRSRPALQFSQVFSSVFSSVLKCSRCVLKCV